MNIVAKVKNAITEHELIQPGAHVLAAVSGGADSIAMLYILHSLAPEMQLRLTVAHLHHGLRAAEADADAAFVNDTARQLQLPCVIARANVRRIARTRKVSLEMAGRAARHDFFRRLVRQRGFDAVAVAHTADDHIETILLKLTRGAGPQALGGITRTTRLHTAQSVKPVNIVRPLRDIWRKELLNYLRRNQNSWREDTTNADPVFLRNRMRHDILPMLKKQLNPRLPQALWRMSEIMEQESEWLEKLTLPMYRQCRGTGISPSLNCELLQAYPLAARRRILRLWLADAGLAPATLDFDTTQRLENLLTPGRSGRRINLPGGQTVRREYSFLKLLTPANTDAEFNLNLKIPGTTMIPKMNMQIICALESKPDSLRTTPDVALVSAAHWRRRRITARNWRAGDRMQPFGMRGTRKLQDIFSDLKIPPGQRQNLPVLTCRDEIIWVPGYRIAAEWAVQPADRRVLRINLSVVNSASLLAQCGAGVEPPGEKRKQACALQNIFLAPRQNC